MLTRAPLITDLAGLLVDRHGRTLYRHPRYGTTRRPKLIEGVYLVKCYGGKSGTKLKWTDESHNLVVNTGLTYTEGVALLTTTQIALTSWFTGITNSAPTPAAGDTSASHAGWVENQNYSQGTRPAWSGVAGAAGASSNSASPSVFSANATSTAGGVFLISNSTKGGTTGTLYSVVAFTGGDRSLLNGDTLNVTYNQSAADDGV